MRPGDEDVPSPLSQQPHSPEPPVRVAAPSPARRKVRGPLVTRGRLLAALAVLVVVAAVVAWRVQVARQAATFKYETAAVDKGKVVARVTATGTLSALVTVQVGSQVSGTISSLTVDYNSPVKKGQVIARIDPRLFQAAVEQARANVVAAEGNLAKARAQAVDAERQARRQRELGDRKLVAQADVDTAQSNAEAAVASVQAAQGSVAQARAGLTQANTNLAYTTIVSPTNGVVISRSVDVGQTVAASLSAPTIFVIAEDLKKMQVDTSVAESDVGRLRDGMPATFTVDAYPGRTFQGAVRQVRNAPQTVQNVVTYDAVVDVENPDLALKPGMTATVTFIYAERDDTLRVPNAALRFRPPDNMPGVDVAQAALAAGGTDAGAPAGRPGGNGEGAGGGDSHRQWNGQGRGAGPGGQGGRGAQAGAGEGREGRVVFVLRNGQPQAVRIRTGISDGTVTEVREGALQAGDLLVTDANGPAGGAPAARGGQRGPPRIF
jgi:HlyD family secretion protein